MNTPPNFDRFSFSLSFGLLLLLAPSFSSAQSGEIPLQASDKVAISIAGVPTDEAVSISKVYTISDAGSINLLHINEIKAAGMKPSQLQKRIEDAYKSAQIYTHPTVTVSMDSTPGDSRLVFVNGGCQKNGPVPYRTGLTLMQAVGTAGGPSPFAKTTRTQLTRTSPTGQRSTTVHDLKRITKDASLDVLLQPNDQIIIPE
ncbi:MAG: polysaccharide biosynthesis/export family protein [Verrucomicrobiaceae bacterium]|nr:polysaccharide biosynthesis/export family protein [Verrucomicrobiaceae bacterium]